MKASKHFSIRAIYLIVMLLVCSKMGNSQHETFTSNHSLTWEACIAGYQALDDKYEQAKLVVIGNTDIGKPLHLFVINSDKVFYPELFDRSKVIVFINNGIHPGEPDGIDASLLLCREWLGGDVPELDAVLEDVIFCVIPVYNVDGSLNRGSNSRSNQNGPEEYGFRGNARNLDLNRDFIKCDSKNAQSFNQIFTRVKPHVFVDTHVSNGADYQHTMTLISTQTDKLGGTLGLYMREKMMPSLFADMKRKGQDMCPYVNTMGRLPESGLVDFLESPRFASGYAALFNSIGFITETHMLKPFPERVESTWQFFESLLLNCHDHRMEIVRARLDADESMLKQEEFFLSWQLDSTLKSSFQFKGYEAKEEASPFAQSTRIRYEHEEPWSKVIPYYNRYKGKQGRLAPQFYIIPQAWEEVVERLEWNHVLVERFQRDTMLEVEFDFIANYQSPKQPYEGHFNHSDVKITTDTGIVALYKGDYLVPVNQQAKRYVIEILEAEGEDSFFSWNFFDSILQQKEWFSDYVFEDKAIEMLASDPKLNKQFNDAVAVDDGLRSSRWEQLYWIYKHSPYFEKTAYRYPVYRYNPIDK